MPILQRKQKEVLAFLRTHPLCTREEIMAAVHKGSRSDHTIKCLIWTLRKKGYNIVRESRYSIIEDRHAS